MRRFRAMIVIAALVSGCGGCVYYHRWTKPGTTAQDFSQDRLRCDVTAAGVLGDGTRTSPDTPRGRRDRVERCLRALGWRDAGIVSWTGGSDAAYADSSN